MGHESDIRLVDPHSKGIGRDHHADVSFEEPSQQGPPGPRRERGMVGSGLDAPSTQQLRDPIDAVAGRCVHDGCASESAKSALEAVELFAF